MTEAIRRDPPPPVKRRDYQDTNEAIDKIEVNDYVEYHDDNDVCLDGHYSLSELKSIIETIEAQS